jgi:type II secretory pathway pseudopilin PulG
MLRRSMLSALCPLLIALCLLPSSLQWSGANDGDISPDSRQEQILLPHDQPQQQQQEQQKQQQQQLQEQGQQQQQQQQQQQRGQQQQQPPPILVNVPQVQRQDSSDAGAHSDAHSSPRSNYNPAYSMGNGDNPAYSMGEPWDNERRDSTAYIPLSAQECINSHYDSIAQHGGSTR